MVLTVDRIDALADAILIARRSKAIAMRAVVVGMGLSAIAMLVAAAGYLAPAAGALLQEGIDVAAIGIALTALLPARTHTVAMAPGDVQAARRLYAQHRDIRPLVEQVRSVVDVRRLLYGLYAVLRLHIAQEEEGPFSLIPACRRACPHPRQVIVATASWVTFTSGLGSARSRRLTVDQGSGAGLRRGRARSRSGRAR